MSSPIGRGFPLGNTAWPVGSIFISVANTNPNILLGYGTWVAFATGRTLVGIDVSQTEFDTVEKTGGAKTHTLTTGEMPSHAHNELIFDKINGGVTQANYHNVVSTTSRENTLQGGTNVGDGIPLTLTTDSAGGGGAHNNLQPFICVFFWKRTA